MKFFKKGVRYQVLPKQQQVSLYERLCCCFSLLPTNSIRISHQLRQKIFIFIGLLFLTAVIIYNYVTSDVYLSLLDPKVPIHQPERGRCCQSASIDRDICGRTDCTWPCSTPAPLGDERYFGRSVDKAFFVETAGHTTTNYRQTCAIESLASLNPNLTVHLLVTAEPNTTSPTMRLLTDNYPNIRITQIRLGDFVYGTPYEHWYFCTDWNRGWYAVAHLSDAMRLLFLFKFGGYYLDLDIVSLRPITSHRNFFVEEGMNKLGNSVIHADYQHPLMKEIVEKFHSEYKWYVWPHNGPDLLTRALASWCGQDYVSWMTPSRCRGFKILPYESFYPIHYLFWRGYFSERDENDHPNWGSKTIGAHVWNSFSAKLPVRKSSNQYYTQMARTSCPKTFQLAPPEF